MKLLKQEVEFWRCLQKRQIGTNMCAELIEAKKFFKLRQVFRVRWLPDDLWQKVLDGADAKTVKRYLQRYSYPSQLAMVMKLSDERLQQLRLGNWVRGKLNSLGLEKGDYIFLAEHASYNLYGAMMFLRKAVLELNRLLTAVDCSPLFTYPHDLWDGGGNDLTPINWEQELRNMTYQVAPEIINKMVLTEDEAIELVNLGSNSLIDAWLGANILREKAITYLDKKGIAFDAKAFVSDNIRRILRAKNINLSQYDL